MKAIRLIFIYCCLFLVIIQFTLFAGTTGKISGRVTDKVSGDGLPGVNVMLVGTTMGAATDMDGYYRIINIPPGAYNLNYSMIGYKIVTVEGTKVNVDRTTNQSMALATEVVAGEEVVIEAERPLVEMDRTSTASYVDAETISELPVQEVSQIIELQAGVVTGNDGAMHFRGGRSREVAYLVDGVPVSDVFSQGGGSTLQIENSVVQELQVISGTFNAEYGSAQSGVVNVVTKTPEEKLSGEFQLFSGDHVSSHTDRFVGIDNINPLAERDFQATFSGPIPGIKNLGFFATTRVRNNESHRWGEERYTVKDGFYIDAYRSWFTDRYSDAISEFGEIPIPDSLITGSGKEVSLWTGSSYSFTGKLTYLPMAQMNLTYTMFYKYGESKNYDDGNRYSPFGQETDYSRSHHHIFSLMHNPSKNIYYNLRFSYQYNKGWEYLYEDPYDPRYQSIGTSDPVTGFVQGDQTYTRNRNRRHVYLLNGDFNWQVGRHNAIKMGFEAKFHDIKYVNQSLTATDETRSRILPDGKELEFDAYVDTMLAWGGKSIPELRLTNNNDASYIVNKLKPREFAAFIQDKIEVGEIILNAGLRLDAFDSQGYTLKNRRLKFSELTSASNRDKSPIKYQLSPRLGLSFPISTRGAFHVSYGHFFQMPSFSRLFDYPIDESMARTHLDDRRVGETDLEPEKTISYEIGLQQQLDDNFAADLTVFYKDIRNLLGVEQITTADVITYQRYVNRDYGNTKGITLAIEKLRTGMITGGIDYTYQVAKGSASDPNYLALMVVSERMSGSTVQYVERQVLPLDWDQRHTVNMTLTFSKPRNWAVSFIGSWGSGLPYTPTHLDEQQLPESEFKNSGRRPVRWELDMKAHKKFKLYGLDYKVFLRVYNIFDHLNEIYVNSTTGRATNIARRPGDLEILQRRLETSGQFSLEELDRNPGWFSNPRKVQIGLSVTF
jgi:outer membrane receptor protein involved in Fe transport